MGNIVQPMWQECPALTRMVVAGYPALSVVLLLLGSVSPEVVARIFSCDLISVTSHYAIWTLFTSAFYLPFQGGMSFLTMLFELYMAMMTFPAREKDMGSCTFFIWMMMVIGLTNVGYLAIMSVISHVADPMEASRPNQGLWPLVMVCLTLRSLADAEAQTSFFGLVQIPNKWYPIALVGFFCLMSMSLQWNLVVALALGYAYPILRLDRCMPRRTRVNGLERRCCSSGRCGFAGGSWIAATATAAYEVETGDRRYAGLTDFAGGYQNSSQQQQETAPASSTPSNFTAFAGSGNRLGEANSGIPLQEVQVQPPPTDAVLTATAPPAGQQSSE